MEKQEVMEKHSLHFTCSLQRLTASDQRRSHSRPVRSMCINFPGFHTQREQLQEVCSTHPSSQARCSGWILHLLLVWGSRFLPIQCFPCGTKGTSTESRNKYSDASAWSELQTFLLLRQHLKDAKGMQVLHSHCADMRIFAWHKGLVKA